jgi:hypothetical protein
MGDQQEKGDLRSQGAAVQGSDVDATGASGYLLTHPMRDLLWKVAQHKYGWTHVSRHGGQYQVAQALERRGLVKFTRDHNWTVQATPAGCDEIARRWPVSPFILRTYEHQPNGWDPVEGVAA